jgi:single-strand DNA-binding protein
MTSITIVGNLTDDPELRFTASGVAVVKFSVAVNRQTFDRTANEWKDAGTSYYRCEAWRHLAEHIAESLQRGSRAVVVGDHREDHWTDEKTQEKRSGWTVTAQAVGAELTFATAKVTKATTGRAGTAPDDPWNTASKQRPPAMAGAPAAPGSWPQGTKGGYSDEPPF